MLWECLLGYVGGECGGRGVEFVVYSVGEGGEDAGGEGDGGQGTRGMIL